MEIHGIQIYDPKDNVLDVKLSDILKEIQNGDNLDWYILFLDGILNPNPTVTIRDYENKINKSSEGFKISWHELTVLDDKFFQLFEILILGSKNPKSLHRYTEDEVMYKSCDVVIELIDCAFWQIFSKDAVFMKRLKGKFKEIESLQLHTDE